MSRTTTLFGFFQKYQKAKDLDGTNEAHKVSDPGLIHQYLSRCLDGIIKTSICMVLLCQWQASFSQATAGTINLTTSTLNVNNGICGVDGLQVTTIQSGSAAACNGESGCTGTVTYLWQTSTNGSSWSSASGTNTNTTYNPPLVTVKTYYRRAFTTPSTDIYSNVVIINPVLTTSGSLSWAGSRSCIQQDTLILYSSGVPSNPLQFSWQYSSISNPPANTCLTCTGSGSWAEQSGSQSGLGAGTFTATSATWGFLSPPSVYCKRLTFAVRTSDSIKCYTTATLAESNFTATGRAGTDGSVTVTSATTITLRSVITNEDDGGTWSRVGSGTGTFTTTGDAASFQVTQGTSHFSMFRYIQSGSSCCNDTSFVNVTVSKSLNLENATFDVKLKSDDEAEIYLKDENIKFKGRFEIERKIQGENDFSKIGEIDLNTIEQSEFVYLDRLPKSAKIMSYRIKNIQPDGNISYTVIKQVTKKIKIWIDFYPSIVNQDVKLLIQNESEDANSVQIKIYDLVGRLLKSDHLDLHKGFNSTVINLQALHQGNYLLHVMDYTNRINNTFQFVKRE